MIYWVAAELEDFIGKERNLVFGPWVNPKTNINLLALQNVMGLFKGLREAV